MTDERRKRRRADDDEITVTCTPPYADGHSTEVSAVSSFTEHHPHRDERRLRPVKVASDILPAAQRIALVDVHGDGTSIGRDKAYTARIRLPVMEVSKHHSNIFALAEEGGSERFFISDAGSTYGTFVLSAGKLPSDTPPERVRSSLFSRLSDAKSSSTPRELQHTDLIRVARTTFEVHIHPWPFSCSACALGEDGSGEIPLLSRGAASAVTTSTSKKKKASTGGPAQASGSSDRKVDAEVDRRREMAQLKDFYLNRHKRQR